MVRAILEGRKTQTRRSVKPQPNSEPGFDPVNLVWRQDGGIEQFCPYGVPGDTLWVRETWQKCTGCYGGENGGVAYKATLPFFAAHKWKPSIHMPRWASRITLTVQSVRVERVQDISGDDAMAEGITHHDGLGVGHSGYRYSNTSPVFCSPDIAFAELWDSINAKRGFSWQSNPWVWVIEFERQEVSRG
jgi:hypothetical protein